MEKNLDYLDGSCSVRYFFSVLFNVAYIRHVIRERKKHDLYKCCLGRIFRICRRKSRSTALVSLLRCACSLLFPREKGAQMAGVAIGTGFDFLLQSALF